VAADNFDQRMRERMPAHRVWHGSTTAPALSRHANDAMWDDMRSRLRNYHEQRRVVAPSGLLRLLWAVPLRYVAGRPLAAIVVAGALLLLSLLGLRR
jgi:hypothetical protein